MRAIAKMTIEAQLIPWPQTGAGRDQKRDDPDSVKHGEFASLSRDAESSLRLPARVVLIVAAPRRVTAPRRGAHQKHRVIT
jgi:hypothetical protein